MMEFVLVIHPADEGGYWAEVPDVDGCFIQGETIEELLADAPLAVASHLEALRQDGQPLPKPRAVVLATVTAPMPSVA
jgi:predicted RNase H-like HicB family nuclease